MLTATPGRVTAATLDATATAQQQHVAPPVVVLDLSPDESNELSHFFYQHTSGRVESEEDLRELLAKADMLVPDVVLAIFFTEFGGPDGVICEEFLDMCRIVKTLHLVSRSGGLGTAAGGRGSGGDGGVDSDDVAMATGGDCQQQPLSADDARDEEELTELFERLQCALRVDVPADVADMIRDRRYVLERALTAGDAASRSNTPRPLPLHADGCGAPPVASSAALQALRAYDDNFKAATILGAATSLAFSGGSDTTAGCGAQLAATPSRRFSREPREQIGYAVRPALDEVLLIAMEVLLEDHHRQPVGTIQHHAIRSELSNFGLVEDGWNKRRSMASLGVVDDDGYLGEETQQQQQRQVEDGSGQHKGGGGVLLADPTLYVPLDVRRFRRLLRTPHHPANQRKWLSKRLQLPSQQGSTGAIVEDQEGDDDGPDLLDVDDDMDGVQDVLKLMQTNAYEAQRRHRRAVSPDDESNDSGIEYVEDPVTGDVTAHLLRSTHGGGRTSRSAHRATAAAGGRSGGGVTGCGDATNEAISGQDLIALAALETDLFMSPSRQRRVKEVGDFVFGRSSSGSNLLRSSSGQQQQPSVGHHQHAHSTAGGGATTPSPVGLHHAHAYSTPPPPPGVDPPGTALPSSRRSFTPRPKEDEDHTTATPEDGGVGGDALPTARRHHHAHSFHRMRSLGGGDVATTSASSATTTHRVHPLQHKLRQIFIRRLHHVRDRLACHPFPVSRRAAVHTGLTPEARSLSPNQVPSQGEQRKKAVGPLFDPPLPHASPGVGGTAGAHASTINDSKSRQQRVGAAIATRRAAVEAAAAEAKYQRDVLDGGFPACDMSYGDFYFVPQLHERPRGTPMFVSKRAPQQPQLPQQQQLTLVGDEPTATTTLDNTVVSTSAERIAASLVGTSKLPPPMQQVQEVVPGICGDLPAPMELRYRTAQNAHVLNASHPNHATHNRVALQHSFLSPQALKTAHLHRSVTTTTNVVRSCRTNNTTTVSPAAGTRRPNTTNDISGATAVAGGVKLRRANDAASPTMLPSRGGPPSLSSLLVSSVASSPPPNVSHLGGHCVGDDNVRQGWRGKKRKTSSFGIVVDPCSRRRVPKNAMVYVAPQREQSDVARTLRSAVARATAELSRHE